MVESTACLLRSYSQPSSSSPDTNLGDPFRCLTSSISLGRYMSESLDWQKWSTFTENRYMEDVKKYSRPGSVAQMKAHFEAHYKKKAAERDAALLEQHNEDYRCNLDQDSMQMDNHITKGKAREEEGAGNMVSDLVELSRCSPLSGQGQATESAQFVENEENRMVDQAGFSSCLQNVEDVQASGCNQTIDGREQNLKQLVKVENPLTSDQVEDNKLGAYGEDGNVQSKATGELKDAASLDKTKPVFSPFKLRGRVGLPKPPVPPKPPSVPILKRQYRKAYSGSIENSVPIKKRQYGKFNSGSKENSADVSNRKAVTRSLHMSIDLAPKEIKKQLSPTLQRLVNSRLVKTLAGKAAEATQGEPLRDTIDIPAHPAVSLQQKKFSSKTPSICTRNVQSPTVPRAFNFKSDERAAKRKEFFKRLEQNEKAKETEKAKLQANLKVKAKNDFKFMNVLATSKVGPSSDSFCSSRTRSDGSKVITAAPCSPFASGDTLKDNNPSRPPRRLTTSCKEVRGKNNQSPAYASKSVSKISTSENETPNIQH